jgi:hypothetical protein
MASFASFVVLLLACQCRSSSGGAYTGNISISSEVRWVNGTRQIFVTVESIADDQHVVVIANRPPHVPLRQVMIGVMKGGLAMKEEELATLAILPRPTHVRQVIERRERDVTKMKELLELAIAQLEKQERAKRDEL